MRRPQTKKVPKLRGKAQPRIGPRRSTHARLPLPVKAALEAQSKARGLTQARIVAEILTVALTGGTP